MIFVLLPFLYHKILLKRQLLPSGQIKNYVSVSRSLNVLELLKSRLLLQVVHADAESRRCPFGNDPDLSLPRQKETITRGKATLLHSHRDVVGRVHEQIVFTKLLQQRAEQDCLVATVRLSRHKHLVWPLQQLKIVRRLAQVVFDLARDEIEHTVRAGLARPFSVRLDVASQVVYESSQRSLLRVSDERSVIREDNRPPVSG